VAQEIAEETREGLDGGWSIHTRKKTTNENKHKIKKETIKNKYGCFAAYPKAG
jgi:hypothetical protein